MTSFSVFYFVFWSGDVDGDVDAVVKFDFIWYKFDNVGIVA